MVGYWLTTIFFVIMLISVVLFFITTIKAAVNTEDAYRIDPDPIQKVDEK